LPAHKHLRRLDSIWIESPIYFVTICVAARRPILANDRAVSVLRVEFQSAPARYGWTVGRFVVMPDHLHFFCTGDETLGSASLSRFIGGLKQWTAKAILRDMGFAPPLWQKQFFDHVLHRTRATNRNGSMFGTIRYERDLSPPRKTGRTAAKSRRSCAEPAL
jgi:REP element-mobilizing transposase RayT